MNRELIPKLDEGNLPALEQCRCSSLAAATLVYERPLFCIGGSLLRRDEFAFVVSQALLVSNPSLTVKARTEFDTAYLCSLLVLPRFGRMDEEEAGELGYKRTLRCISGSLLRREGLTLMMSMSSTPLASARSLETEARTELDTASIFSLLVLPRAGRMDEDEVGELGYERILLCIGGSLYWLAIVMSMQLTPLVSARSLEADAHIELDVTPLLSFLLHPRCRSG